MKLDITPISKQPGESLPFQFVTGWSEIGSEEDAVFEDGIEVSGRAVNVGEGIYEVTAHVRAVYEGECARCLAPVQVPLEFDLCERFVRAGSEQNEEWYPFANDALALDDFVRDGLLLQAPLRVLCKPDCKGLCPVCGCNLNETPHCSCEENARPTGPMAALAALFNDEEEEV